MSGFVKSVTLTPWALTCIQGALRRDATAHSKFTNSSAAKQLIADDEQLCSLFKGINGASVDHVVLTVHEKEKGERDA